MLILIILGLVLLAWAQAVVVQVAVDNTPSGKQTGAQRLAVAVLLLSCLGCAGTAIGLTVRAAILLGSVT